jgi:hypothetical protein
MEGARGFFIPRSSMAMYVVNRDPPYGLLASEGGITRSGKYVADGV